MFRFDPSLSMTPPGKSSLTDLAGPVGVWLGVSHRFQRANDLIADGHGEGKHLGAHKEEKLTAFRNSNLRFALAERPGDCRVREVTLDKVSRIK